MDTLLLIMLFVWAWLLHLGIALIFSGPIILKGWDRAQFKGWEGLVFVVPYGIWMSAFLINDTGKSLANLGEAIYISSAIVVAALVRVVAGHSRWAKRVPIAVFSLVCATAFCAYWFTPGWPE